MSFGRKLFLFIFSIISIIILTVNYKRTVEYRTSTPSWEYYHDPFWFTYFYSLGTAFDLVMGFVGSLLLTMMIMKIKNKISDSSLEK